MSSDSKKSPEKSKSGPQSEQEGLDSIPTSRWARATRLTKLTASMGAAALGSKIAQAFTDKATQEAKNRLFQINQARKIVETLSQMKGAAMKLGQILSMHGDTLFPAEVTAILSKLQANSDFMVFAEIEKVIKKELGENYNQKLLDLSKRPVASASIGQVHKASLEDGTWVAVKIQYPGVEESIDSDVDSLSSLLKVVASLPTGESFDEVINEVKEILHLETDYLEEGRNLEFFAESFRHDSRVLVPRYFKEFSTKRILTTEFVKGLTVQEYRDGSFSESERSEMGQVFLRVFYHELFRLGVVQTDPNFGNYKLLPESKQLLLLDFGAVKKFTGDWRLQYIEMVKAAYDRNRQRVLDYSYELGLLRSDDTELCKDLHLQLCEMFLEPFRDNQVFRFQDSDLPLRMRAMVPKIIGAFKLRAPPRHIIFLNRKMIGTYLFLSAIKASFNPRSLLEEYLVSR